MLTVSVYVCIHITVSMPVCAICHGLVKSLDTFQFNSTRSGLFYVDEPEDSGEDLLDA